MQQQPEFTQNLWRELHARALHHEDGKKDDIWISHWSRKIPRFVSGCKCNEHWSKWYPKNRPDYSTKDTYFAWTVKAHNEVNGRLNKQIWTVEEAKLAHADVPAPPEYGRRATPIVPSPISKAHPVKVQKPNVDEKKDILWGKRTPKKN